MAVNLWIRSALLSLFAGVAACAHSGPKSPPLTVDMKPYVGRLVTLDVQVGERETHMLFDTGAGVTAVTPELASAFNCAPFGRLVGHRMSGERVDFEKCGRQTISFGAYSASSDMYVFDLMALLPEGLPALGGIVSLASFSDHPFTLDLTGQKLVIETERSLRERTQNAKQADLRIIKGTGGDGEITTLVRIEAETGDLWFLLDSGNLDHVIVAAHAIDQLGVEIDPETVSNSDNILDLELEIAGAYSVAVTARVRDILYDGALNEDVMRRFLITFDLENENIWFSKADEAGPASDD